jgi:hypothetical protein
MRGYGRMLSQPPTLLGGSANVFYALISEHSRRFLLFRIVRSEHVHLKVQIAAIPNLQCSEHVVQGPKPNRYTTLAMLNIEPPEPKNSGSNADDPINLAHLLGMLHIVDLIC